MKQEEYKLIFELGMGSVFFVSIVIGSFLLIVGMYPLLFGSFLFEKFCGLFIIAISYLYLSLAVHLFLFYKGSKRKVKK